MIVVLRWIKYLIEFWRIHLAWPIFGWLIFFLPVLLVIAATCMPNMLEGLLILRTDYPKEFFWDLLYLSFASLVVSAMGGGIVRLFDLYARLRFNIESVLVNEPSVQGSRKTDWLWWSTKSSSWPVSLTIVWIVVAGYLPYRAFCVTSHSLTLADPLAPDKLFGKSWMGTFLFPFFIAVVFTFLWFCTVSLVHLGWARLRRSESAACGMIPFEDTVDWVLKKLFGKQNSVVIRPIQWPWISPGFTEPDSRRILPGHMQIVVMFSMATIFYAYLFASSYGGNKWPEQWYPVGVYAMLIGLLISSGLGWAFFLLGRHQVSILFVAGLGLLLLYSLGNRVGFDANHYFVLSPYRSESLMVAKKGEGEVLPSFLQCLQDQYPKQDRAYAERQKLYEIYKNWKFPKGPDGKTTMFVVNASGGGIQASAWTAHVLVGLDRKLPQFSESIGLLSGVSGGSVGVMYYMGKRPFRFNDENNKMQLTEDQRQGIVRAASDSCLESVGWGLAFPDLARSVFPFPVWDREIDRGWALESRWWNRMGRNEFDAPIMKELRIRDLVRPVNYGHIPPTVFNATAVETGQRVMIANFVTNQESMPDLTNDGLPATSRIGDSVSYNLPRTPIDLLDFYEPLHIDRDDVNPRISTSVRLSASFAYVTPVARPLITPKYIKPKASDELGKRLNLHVCDGGYSDNTGIVTTVVLIAEMLEEFRSRKIKPPFERIWFINIESFPENAVIVENDPTGLQSGFLGPANALANARVSSQAERSDLELELLKQSYGGTFGEGDNPFTTSYTRVLEDNKQRFDEYEVAVKGMSETAGSLVRSINQSGKKDDVSDIADSLDSISDHEKIVDARSLGGTWGRINRTVNSARNLQLAAGEWKQQIGEAIGDESKELMAILEEQAKKVSELALQLPAKPNQDFSLNVEIKSTQFRFNSEQKCSDSESLPVTALLPPKGKIETPPLSWLLSPIDKHRLAEAWKAKACQLVSTEILDKQGKQGGAKTASSGDSPTHTEVTPTTGLSRFQSVVVPPGKLGNYIQVNE